MRLPSLKIMRKGLIALRLFLEIQTTRTETKNLTVSLLASQVLPFFSIVHECSKFQNILQTILASAQSLKIRIPTNNLAFLHPSDLAAPAADGTVEGIKETTQLRWVLVGGGFGDDLNHLKSPWHDFYVVFVHWFLIGLELLVPVPLGQPQQSQ